MIQWKQPSFFRSRWGRGAMLLVMLFFGTAFYLHESGALSPGPLSAVQPKGESLGGFPSHAAFEQECGHCHAPIHCVKDTRCQDCHLEVARQRLAADGLHGRLPAQRCQTCHVEHQGRQAIITAFAFANVDHEKLAHFSLVHHHQDYDGNPLTCQSCHSQDRFIRETLDCITCHVEEAHDLMAEHIEQFGTNCVDCHDGRDRMTDFDHNQTFPLDGQHEAAACEDCHMNQLFGGTPADCAACHPEPLVHAGQFGLDCVRCHTAGAWSPAQLTRHTFRLNHGGQEEVPCQRCHPEAYGLFDCYQCHDHQPEAIRQTHLAEGLVEFEDCAACHPTGEAGEAASLNSTLQQQGSP